MTFSLGSSTSCVAPEQDGGAANLWPQVVQLHGKDGWKDDRRFLNLWLHHGASILPLSPCMKIFILWQSINILIVCGDVHNSQINFHLIKLINFFSVSLKGFIIHPEEHC